METLSNLSSLSLSTVQSQLLSKLGLSLSLKDLITLLRSTKTLQQEREIISKESAYLRSTFKQATTNSQDIAKLLYIHMLGYPAHFGQVECVKLIASNRLVDKRLGYLGVMLLLDEKEEVLTLVVNSLKNDLSHSNVFVVGLALNTLACIASVEMARDLIGFVEKLMGGNTYVKKKACLCMIRLVEKVKSAEESMVLKAKGLLEDNNHGVIMSACALLCEIRKCGVDVSDCADKVAKQLKTLNTIGHSPEHDVGGIPDPFLQCSLLRVVREIGIVTHGVSSVMGLIVSNTNDNKNVGCAVLYECVRVCLLDPSLNSMAVQILTNFLTKDNNSKYVSLNLLKGSDASRHKQVVYECIHDFDVSIRKRAVMLLFDMLNNDNVKEIVSVIVEYCKSESVEENSDVSSIINQLLGHVEKYAKQFDWYISTIIDLLTTPNANILMETLQQIIITIFDSTKAQQTLATKEFYKHINTNYYTSLICVWLVGEYGNMLEERENLISKVENAMYSAFSDATLIEYGLVTLVKLSERLKAKSQILSILQKYTKHANIEVQTRAVEFTHLLQLDNIAGILDAIPLKEKESFSVQVKQLKITFSPSISNYDTLLTVSALMTSSVGLNDVLMQVAVPKSMRLQMFPSSSNALSGAGGVITQSFKISNETKVPIKMRLKVSFVVEGGEKVDEIVEYNGFQALFK